jgi:hypothetical protein
MAFRKGAEEAEQASKYASFEKTNFLKVESGKPKVLRFITDATVGKIVGHMLVQCDKTDPEAIGAWITVQMHQGTPTKPRPSDYKGDNYPTAMPAVCRYDKAFAGDPERGIAPDFSDCYIHDVLMPQNAQLKKPAPRQWAWAVEREPVIGDGTPETGGPSNQGKTVGYRDATRTVTRKKEGSDETEEFEEKAIIIVNQAYRNFFGALTGFAGGYGYGTALDRDYVVQRKGENKDTDYNLIPLDPINVADPDDPTKQVPFDLRDERILKARYGKTHAEFDKALQEIISARASDDYYGMWFIPGYKREGSATDDGGSAPANNEPDEATMNALRDRIEGYQAGADGPLPPTEQPAAIQEPAAAVAGGMKSYD